MIDSTLHLGDLIVLAGIVGGGVTYLVKMVTRSYDKFQKQIGSHSEELSLHAGVLEQMGWRRPKDAQFKPHITSIIIRAHGEPEL